MIELHWGTILMTGLLPMITGFIWYHPKVFGNLWMKEAGVSNEMIKSSNMLKILGISLVLGVLLAVALTPIVIHQMGIFAALQGVNDPKASDLITEFMSNYGKNFRTFKHGALHGFLTGITLAMPVIGMNALFERKSIKYILIHVGYWTLTATLMGGIICGFA